VAGTGAAAQLAWRLAGRTRSQTMQAAARVCSVVRSRYSGMISPECGNASPFSFGATYGCTLYRYSIRALYFGIVAS
jgi:hypothetical protein